MKERLSYKSKQVCGGLVALVVSGFLGAPVIKEVLASTDVKLSSNNEKPASASESLKSATPLPTPVTHEDLVQQQIQKATETPAPTVEVQEQNEIRDIVWMPETVKQWSSLIIESARKYSVDPKLVAGVILCESGGHPYAISSSGAEGLGQIMPTTAPNINRFDPRANIEFCASYLATQYKRFGDWTKAICAYNAGPGNVAKGIIPDQTKNYIYWVGGMWGEVGQKESSIYKEWLKHSALVTEAKKYLDLDPRVKTALDFAFKMKFYKARWVLGAKGEQPDGTWANDCSGLTFDAYAEGGIIFTGVCCEGYPDSKGRVVSDQWKYNGRRLKAEEATRPGDLIFFNNLGHVGTMFFRDFYIHINKATGGVSINSLNSSSRFYRQDLAKGFMGYVRIVN